MWKDPMVEEVRRERDAYAAQFNYDLNAIVRDLRAEQARLQQEGWEVVSFPPRRPESEEPKAA